MEVSRVQDYPPVCLLGVAQEVRLELTSEELLIPLAGRLDPPVLQDEVEELGQVGEDADIARVSVC